MVSGFDRHVWSAATLFTLLFEGVFEVPFASIEHEIYSLMASNKKNQTGVKQRTLLNWMRPEPSPKKNENREEQITEVADLETTSGVQAAETSNSSIKATRQEPDLLAPGLASVSQGPNQPKSFKFPTKTFGNNTKKRSFQPAWFDQRSWLHYDEETDTVFCNTCLKAIQNNMLSSTKADPAFTRIGFGNWKNAMDKKKGFQKHESSESHREAVARYVTAPATTVGDVGELLSDKHA